MSKKDKHFIYTSDQETCQKLRDLGFQEINYDGTRWCFLNDTNEMKFSTDGMKDVHTTNVLHF